jgi:hypothetical protein
MVEVLIPDVEKTPQELGYAGEAAVIMDGFSCHESGLVIRIDRLKAEQVKMWNPSKHRLDADSSA